MEQQQQREMQSAKVKTEQVWIFLQELRSRLIDTLN